MYRKAYIKGLFKSWNVLNLISTELFTFRSKDVIPENWKHSKQNVATSNRNRDHHLIKRSQKVSLEKLAIQNKLIVSLSLK